MHMHTGFPPNTQEFATRQALVSWQCRYCNFMQVTQRTVGPSPCLSLLRRTVQHCGLGSWAAYTSRICDHKCPISDVYWDEYTMLSSTAASSPLLKNRNDPLFTWAMDSSWDKQIALAVQLYELLNPVGNDTARASHAMQSLAVSMYPFPTFYFLIPAGCDSSYIGNVHSTRRLFSF